MDIARGFILKLATNLKPYCLGGLGRGNLSSFYQYFTTYLMYRNRVKQET
jgi:hypothetical protein